MPGDMKAKYGAIGPTRMTAVSCAPARITAAMRAVAPSPNPNSVVRAKGRTSFDVQPPKQIKLLRDLPAGQVNDRFGVSAVAAAS